MLELAITNFRLPMVITHFPLVNVPVQYMPTLFKSSKWIDLASDCYGLISRVKSAELISG